MSPFLLNYVYNHLLTYSYGNSMLNILRNLQLVFYSNSTILQFAIVNQFLHFLTNIFKNPENFGETMGCFPLNCLPGVIVRKPDISWG